jgi:hypothetical protein
MTKGKATNIRVSQAFLDDRAKRAMAKGFEKQKWIEFCETLLGQGFDLSLYEARRTASKYITVRKGALAYKVRFSNHKPNKGRELEGDCDFFVGRTHTGIRTTSDCLRAVREFFGESVK